MFTTHSIVCTLKTVTLRGWASHPCLHHWLDVWPWTSHVISPAPRLPMYRIWYYSRIMFLSFVRSPMVSHATVVLVISGSWSVGEWLLKPLASLLSSLMPAAGKQPGAHPATCLLCIWRSASDVIWPPPKPQYCFLWGCRGGRNYKTTDKSTKHKVMCKEVGKNLGFPSVC